MTITLPCKIGDLMWGLRNVKGCMTVQQGIVSEMFFDKDMEIVVVLKHICRGTVGHKIFHTSEEAYSYIKKGEQ